MRRRIRDTAVTLLTEQLVDEVLRKDCIFIIHSGAEKLDGMQGKKTEAAEKLI